MLDYRKKGVGPETVQALRGATLCWNAYGPYIDKNPEVVAAFTRANNEAIVWIQSPQNRDELYKVIANNALAISVPTGTRELKGSAHHAGSRCRRRGPPSMRGTGLDVVKQTNRPFPTGASVENRQD